VAIITVSRQFGSNGEMIAEVLAEAAGFLLLNKKSLEELLVEHHIPEIRLEWINESSPHDIAGLEDERIAYLDFVKETISDLGQKGHVVFLGRGGQFLFQGYREAINIKVLAAIQTRTANIQARFDVDKAAALRLINQKDAERLEYALFFHRGDSNDPQAYDLVLNTSRLSIEEAMALILCLLEERGIVEESRLSAIKQEAGRLIADRAATEAASKNDRHKQSGNVFANESEEEFARILDYYKIDYLYEPTTFPLKWDSEGNIESAFTPDFYFPDFDLYIELTTMKQDLVTKKNRKLRELKNLYPDVNIKLFYRKDFRKLLEKFGITE